MIIIVIIVSDHNVINSPIFICTCFYSQWSISAWSWNTKKSL